MAKALQPQRTKDLVRWLHHVQRLHQQLLSVVRAKIDAMRRADLPALRDLGERERVVVQRLHKRQALRPQLMDEIGEEMGLSQRTTHALSMSQLASRLSAAHGARVLAAAEGARRAMTQVAQANRVAGAVSRELINHLRWIFAAVKPKDAEPAGYRGDGGACPPADLRIFEAIG